MKLSPEQAAAALQDVNRVSSRSADLYEYQQASPYLILWGIVWAIGYSLSDFFPTRMAMIWLVADSIGVIGSILIARSNAKTSERDDEWRHAAAGLTLGGFIAATFSIMPPHSGDQVSAFIPLVIATMYILIGIWNGMRLVITGIAVAMLTLLGFFFLPAHFNLWMAGVGGGALVLAGIWLRRV